MPLQIKKRGVTFDRWGYVFVLPFVAIFLIFQLVPVVNTLFMGFTDLKGASNEFNWVGFSNFAREVKNVKIEGLSADQARSWTDALDEKGYTFATNAPAAASPAGEDPFALDLGFLDGGSDAGASADATASADGSSEANALGNTPDMFVIEGINDQASTEAAIPADGYYLAYTKMETAEFEAMSKVALEVGIPEEVWKKAVSSQMTGVIFDENFYRTIWNNLILWFFNFVPQLLFALLFAVWLTDIQLRIRVSGLFKTIFYMPNILMTTAIAVLYNSLFGAPAGPINQILAQNGIIDRAIEFLRDPIWTRAIVSFIQFWMWFGPTMIIIIAGIVGIPKSLYESALVDGASKGQIFRFITLPLLKPVMSYVLVTSVIGGLQMFEIPFLLTNRRGDPQGSIETPSIYIYNQAFSSANNYSYASALSIGMFVIILILAMIVFVGMRDKDEAKSKKLARQLRRAGK